MVDVIILTDSRHVNPKEQNAYNKNVLLEDFLIQKDLESLGLRVSRHSWDDTHLEWADTKYALFRSTWDYFNRIEEFSQWLSKVSQQTQLLNSVDTISWNMDKHYLREIQKKGINCIPMVFVDAGSKKTLKQLHEETGWSSTVLKPIISGGAKHTYRLHKDSLQKHEPIFKTLIRKEGFILQPFQNNIVKTGEISLIVIDGSYTHAVLKVAKKGDFRVQDDFGGKVHDYFPSTEEVRFAEKIVQDCEKKPIYARVDFCRDNYNALALVELELIEPELWFRRNTMASIKLAEAIKKLF